MGWGRKAFRAGGLERFMRRWNLRGFRCGLICDSRCWLEKEASIDDPTSFQ